MMQLIAASMKKAVRNRVKSRCMKVVFLIVDAVEIVMVVEW